MAFPMRDGVLEFSVACRQLHAVRRASACPAARFPSPLEQVGQKKEICRSALGSDPNSRQNVHCEQRSHRPRCVGPTRASVTAEARTKVQIPSSRIRGTSSPSAISPRGFLFVWTSVAVRKLVFKLCIALARCVSRFNATPLSTLRSVVQIPSPLRRSR
jgi:hypothetical protein